MLTLLSQGHGHIFLIIDKYFLELMILKNAKPFYDKGEGEKSGNDLKFYADYMEI